MRADNLWERFGQPDYAMAFHVASVLPTGMVGASTDSPYSGADTVDIYIPGVGAHGASPHRGIDPIVLGLSDCHGTADGCQSQFAATTAGRDHRWVLSIVVPSTTLFPIWLTCS
jgi:hypothetical protein